VTSAISPVPSAADRFVDLIAEAGGAVRFDRFMHECLYGGDGFYTSGRGQAGRRGDFITSPEIGPLFGTVIARALDSWWSEVGRPENFRVVEVGAGPGSLARSILAARPECLEGRPAAYVAVEVSEHQRSLHPESVTSTDRVPDGEITGVVFANELLDNMPFRLLVGDGRWREAWVTERNGQFLEVLREIDTSAIGTNTIGDVDVSGPAPLGARIPWQQSASTLAADIATRLRGRLVVVDYMVATTSELARRPWREWLRTYAGHERGSHYLVRPGEQDITGEVCIDQLRAAIGEPIALRTQAHFLQRWGIDELVEEGKRIWTEKASRPDLEAVKMRSRVSESEALTDPGGLGSFTVVEFQGAL
jgi:SAM-dependent MidA family methyltransferase